jgi:predicted dehydrogenase
LNRKVRWGVLGTAGIARNKVIPAMQRGDWSEVVAIASRNLEKATWVAERFGIPKAYGSYEELLADDDLEAIYNPLPNHLHVPWTTRAAEAGKHVLCEKPIGLNMEDAARLLAVRDRTGMKIQEAFMVLTHPQWLAAAALVKAGRIGELRAISGFFSYFNPDPENIRNKVDIGGGGLMDVGCYPITIARFIFGEEPRRVTGLIERDEQLGIDRVASAILDFPSGYGRVLEIDSDPRDLQVYLGELYLDLHDPRSATEELKVLEGLCPEGCKQHDMLAAQLPNETRTQRERAANIGQALVV